MPTTTQHIAGAAPASTTEDYELSRVGIEFEYPVADDSTGVPGAREGATSGTYYNQYREEEGRDWLPSLDIENMGYMGSDHTGCEITSGILNLHTDEPERWYEASIQRAEEDGYPFAETGWGDTNFGLHNHLSTVPTEKKREIAEMCSNEWARVFFCSSINEQSLDPWRHAGVRSPGSPWSRRSYREPGHEEFRLIEPLTAEHLGLVMDFWRMVETDGVDYAADVARQLVLQKDERITAIRRYNALDEHLDDWPNEGAVAEGHRTDPSAALWFRDLME